MIKNKKIAAILLAGSMVLLSGCVFGKQSNVDKDYNEENAQLTESTAENTDDALQTSENEKNGEETDNTDNTDADAKDNTTDSASKIFVDENTYLFPKMNTKYHAKYGDYTYYREYSADDFEGSVYLYFNQNYKFAEKETVKRIMRVDREGNVEPFVDKDYGEGDMYAAGGKLFCQARIIGGYNPSYNIYIYDLDNGTEMPLPGLGDLIGYYGDYVFTQANGLIAANGDPIYDAITIFDANTLKPVGECFGTYAGADETGVYTYKAELSTENDNASFDLFRTDYTGFTKTVLHLNAEDMKDLYFDWSPAEVTCIQSIGDYLFVNVGCYGGTGHFYQNGLLYSINKNTGKVELVTATTYDAFLAIKNDDNVSVFVSRYDDETSQTVVDSFVIDGMKYQLEGYLYEKFGSAFINYDKRKIQSYNFNYGDVGIYPTENGEVFEILDASEYEAFGFTFGQATEDYDTSDYTDIYNIEYAGDFLFFTITTYTRQSGDDIGWRYAYVPVRTVDFMKNLKTGEIKILNEY
ncbi:MAG: hypothetical protein K5776_12535 [Lachnospiraceae bacterium]|nr:hypothetical protein [Lachnospiraceae bacterium]